MRRAAWAGVAAFVLTALGCGPGAAPNTGPPLQKTQGGPGPMKSPVEGGAPSLPPGQK